MTRAIALPLICAVAALTAAGCGESAGAGGDADPAALVPASAPIYAEAAVQPTGERREDALAAAGKLLRTGDPAGKLRQLIDDGLAENGGGLTWEKDFAPWLGEDAGVWASNLEAPEPSWAVIVASKDAGAAETALGRFREDDADTTYTNRSYDGVDYAVDSERVANGVIDDFVVIGTEDAFKRTADMRDEGKALADADRYKDAVGDLDDESLGHYYMDLRPVFEAALKQDPATAAQLEQFRSALPFDRLGPITGAFEADGEGMSLDTVVTGVPEGPFRDVAKLWSGSEAELLAGLPGDAWGALAIPGLGAAAESTINSFAGAIGGAAVAAQVKQATGLDLSQDILSWVGDVGGFVRGADEASLDGALVIQATDDAKAETAFGKLIGVIGKQSGAAPRPVKVDGAEAAFALPATGADKPVVMARGEGRVVVGYGDAATTAALEGDGGLGDSEVYGDAKDVLGDDVSPSFLLSMPAVITLVDAMGETDPDFKEARPYLETLGSIATGGKADGDRIESRVAVSLK